MYAVHSKILDKAVARKGVRPPPVVGRVIILRDTKDEMTIQVTFGSPPGDSSLPSGNSPTPSVPAHSPQLSGNSLATL